MAKVFISYSHDSDEHRDFVRGIAGRLRRDGVDCLIDRYINGFPPEGWPRWMENQIEAADYVLLVCTETYLRRYRGQETEGGRGVNFEGVVISQTLYDHYYQNSKFIPVIPDDGDFEHVPLPLKPYSTYRLSSQYADVYRILTGQAEYVQPELGEVRLLPAAIFSDDLPAVEGELFGRKEELALLDEAFKTPHPNPSPQGRGASPHIVQFVASGGTGKTKLIRHWLDENNDKIEALIAWSFYSQGSSEDKQISATPFFMQTLKSLGSDKSVSDFNTEEEKGEYVANLLREKRCLLVLDGLEPLQQVGRGMRGELKDRAIRKMLRCLMGNHSNLCIITTRLPVHELKGRRQVVQHDLQNLALEDGVALLRSFGVSGRDVDMLAAVEEYGRHALALHLLGNALATYLDGDVRKRDTLTELMGDYDEAERHAFKVMQAYEHWLEGTPELKLLYLLGLFDHPVEQDVLEVLWEAEIPGLTAEMERKAWLVARRDLISKFRMMSANEIPSISPFSKGSTLQSNSALSGEHPPLQKGERGGFKAGNTFDCHPLIREYFGRQLKVNQAEAWRQAHTVLYEYYKGLPEKLWGKYLPDTLEEMQPLFRAITYGCSAGRYQDAIEIYAIRLNRGPEHYFFHKISSYADSLALLSCFFQKPWSILYNGLNEASSGGVFNFVGTDLSGMCRFNDAIEPLEIAANLRVEQGCWSEAEVNFRGLSEAHLSLGNLIEATNFAQQAVFYGQQQSDMLYQMASLTTLANCFHQTNLKEMALKEYQKAETIQKNDRPYEPFLYGVQGYNYCDLLLEVGDNESAHDRIKASLNIATGKREISLLSNMLPILSLAKAFNKEGEWELFEQAIDDSIAGLRLIGRQDYLLTAILVHVSYLGLKENFSLSYNYLQEIYEIAEPSGMRLHLTDYHLEMARLILAVEADPAQYPEATPEREQRILPFADQEEPGILILQGHIAEADRLINETGYHRRDAELAELKQQADMS